MSRNDANLRATAILDYRSEPIRALSARLEHAAEYSIDYLKVCHRFLRAEVLPVYTIDELQPVSVTLAKQKGSCSQRFACLEAFARAIGTPTRVRGLWIDGQFWAPRFRLTRLFIPHRVLLALPQFHLNGDWMDVEELFGKIEVLAKQNPVGFTNDGESLFDAVSHVAVDFHGKSLGCSGVKCDLSHFVIGDAGTFASRDELFATHPMFQKSFRGRAFEWLYGGRKSA